MDELIYPELSKGACSQALFFLSPILNVLLVGVGDRLLTNYLFLFYSIECLYIGFI